MCPLQAHEADNSTRHVFSEHYQLLTSDDAKLGEGQFAIVRKGINRATGAVVAVKCIKLSQLTKEDEDALEVEVEVMRKVCLIVQCVRVRVCACSACAVTDAPSKPCSVHRLL